MKKTVAVILCAALSAQCAGVRAMQGGARVQEATRVDPALVRSTAERIPAGARVRVTLTDGRQMKAVIVGVDAQDVVVRERTRIPEPPVRIPAERITSIELDQGMGFGKALAIGVAIGVGLTFSVLAILFATLDD
ncbi:MAG: hypothetical protein HYU53_05460 [Acidobacteria bacterium]|nr:hypothetical protein [Acidobacteriota bacterium]